VKNVKNGLLLLKQSNVPIERPDDFFAEMLKSDSHMLKVKNKLVKQQVTITGFEERKQKKENKKFAKAIQSYRIQEKSKEKKKNFEAIDKWKKEIKDKGESARGLDDFMGSKERKQQKTNYVNMMKEQRQSQQKNKKRPGKARRMSTKNKRSRH